MCLIAAVALRPWFRSFAIMCSSPVEEMVTNNAMEIEENRYTRLKNTNNFKTTEETANL